MLKKPQIVLALALIAAGLLAACSPQAAAPTPQPAATQAPAAPEGAYPYPAPAIPTLPADYPPAAQEVDAPAPGLAYPDLADGAEITWEQALGLIVGGQVVQVSQRHDLTVFLTLQDGRTLKTVEPSIDEVLRVVESCGEACAGVRMATE